MKLRKLNLVMVILWLVAIGIAASCAPAANAAESTQPVKHKGYIDRKPLVVTTKPTRSGVTTKGWVGNRRITLKSTTRNGRTTTKGYVGGKYVRIKTKKE
jgi:hypothetical protein